MIGVIRHGDRTPKQKMKMLVTHKKFFDLFEELNGYESGHLKIKKPRLLQVREREMRKGDQRPNPVSPLHRGCWTLLAIF